MNIKTCSLAASLVKWTELRFKVAHCPVCEGLRPALKLSNNEIGVRCLWCRASAVTMSFVSVLATVLPDLGLIEVYEASSRGPLVHYLKRRAAKVTCSEYFTDVPSGEFRNGIMCQDLQSLTFADESFDLCTSTEVLEHVPDDLKAFTEIRRVLKPGGVVVFSVPLNSGYETVERVRVAQNREFEHLLPAEYHGDPFRRTNILTFRNYGRDILKRLKQSGFINASIIEPENIPWGYVRPIIVAYKEKSRST